MCVRVYVGGREHPKQKFIAFVWWTGGNLSVLNTVNNRNENYGNFLAQFSKDATENFHFFILAIWLRTVLAAALLNNQHSFTKRSASDVRVIVMKVNFILI